MPTTRSVAWVTGSERSPPGGETAATTVSAPFLAGRPIAVTRPDALEELAQPAGEIGRIALLPRHLGQAGADLPQRLRPARQAVGQERHPVPHVAVVLGDGDPEVDRRLARGDRHVGGVHHHDGAVHDRAAGARVDQGRELAQHLGHLVAPFAAADVDHDVGLGVLRQRLLDDRLAGAEAAGHGDGAALRHRKEEVEHPLAGHERTVVGQPGRDRARPPHRPGVGQADLRPIGQAGRSHRGSRSPPPRSARAPRTAQVAP